MKKIKNLKTAVSAIAILVFIICFYCFLLGNKVFDGKFENESVSWYFLAKGFFCSVALYLMVSILENVKK